MVHSAWYSMADAWCIMLSAFCIVTDTWLWCMVHSAWCIMVDAWHMIHRGTLHDEECWFIIHDAGSIMYDALWLIHDTLFTVSGSCCLVQFACNLLWFPAVALTTWRRVRPLSYRKWWEMPQRGFPLISCLSAKEGWCNSFNMSTRAKRMVIWFTTKLHHQPPSHPAAECVRGAF